MCLEKLGPVLTKKCLVQSTGKSIINLSEHLSLNYYYQKNHPTPNIFLTERILTLDTRVLQKYLI